MRRLAAPAAILLVVATLACRRPPPQPPAADFTRARRALEDRGRTDQAVREGFGVGGQVDSGQLAAMARTDSANARWLGDYVARRGWPTRDQVGKEAVEAAFLIVQHAVHDTAFMRAMLPHIEESYRRGDLDGGAAAMLTDRLEVKAGRPQLYGTQLSLKDGRWVLDSLADSAGVDERRRRLGMPPLAEYLRLVDSVMRGP
jgi:hypothetical protein